MSDMVELMIHRWVSFLLSSSIREQDLRFLISGIVIQDFGGNIFKDWCKINSSSMQILLQNFLTHRSLRSFLETCLRYPKGIQGSMFMQQSLG